MKVIVVTNGKTQLVILPENELDKILLNQLEGGVVELVASAHILDNAVNGGLIISSSSK